MRIFHFVLSFSLWFLSSVFVSGVLESSRGAHQTGTEENISKHKDKEETERASLIFHTGSERLHVLCAFFVCLRVCTPGRDRSCKLEACSGLLADDHLHRLTLDANGAFQLCTSCLNPGSYSSCGICSVRLV